VFCYLGDARFNMADSYLIGGREARAWTSHREPEVLWAARRDRRARALDRERDGGRSRSPTTSRGRARRRRAAHRRLGLDGRADEVWAERIELLKPYQVNAETRAATGNPT
jgi:ornithine carbamoyltransferase